MPVETETKLPILNKVLNWLNKPVHSAPLVYVRAAFGALMLFSTLRFWALGWIDSHYIQPLFHFRYFGFSWIPIGPDWLIYIAHLIMVLTSIGILLGAYYRVSSLLFFLSFTYCELIDLTYYLNHYYFVSLISLILIFLPAHRNYSLDVNMGRVKRSIDVPRWSVFLIQFQLFVVYFYAGWAKINPDWLFHALPLKIWLPAHDTLPLVGPLLKQEWLAYFFSISGMLYDLTIVFFLLWKRTRWVAYASVLFFHMMTGFLFQIGVFPIVMIVLTPVFFDVEFHKKLFSFLDNHFRAFNASYSFELHNRMRFLSSALIGLYVLFQILFPLRFLFYPGNVFWTEQGYRFSWRVMLMEKSGSAQFYVKDSKTGREGIVDNSDFLNRHQEKQMAFQPDMILQYAHFLADYYTEQGLSDPQVRVKSYVTLNARPSQLFIDSTLDLTTIHDSWEYKSWILPLK